MPITPTTQPFQLHKPNKEKIISLYIKTLSSFGDKLIKNKADEGCISLSSRALENAVRDITKDLNILSHRRAHNSLSRGKLAGVVTFRMSKWHIISTREPLSEDKAGIKLNDLVALGFAFKYCLHVEYDKLPPSISREIQYTIARRHTNQETLGICFDVIYEYYKKLNP